MTDEKEFEEGVIIGEYQLTRKQIEEFQSSTRELARVFNWEGAKFERPVLRVDALPGFEDALKDAGEELYSIHMTFCSIEEELNELDCKRRASKEAAHFFAK